MRVSPIARLRRWTRLCLTTFAVLTGTAAPALAQPVPAVTEYYHLDALGSTRVVTSQTGAVLRHYEFGPFGGQDSQCTQSPDERLFTGQVRDRETCLDYFGARHMRSTFGRFLTIDPVLDRQAALVDPQQWNRYAYARNNPMKFVDPDGKEIAVRVGNRFVGVGLEAVAASTSNGNFEFGVLLGIATLAAPATRAVAIAGDLVVTAVASCGASASCLRVANGTLEFFSGVSSRASSVESGSTATLRGGYYEVNGLRFSKRYYERLWDEGRKAPSLVAQEVLRGAGAGTPDRRPGFFRYEFGGWELVYNPRTREVWHLQPFKGRPE